MAGKASAARKALDEALFNKGDVIDLLKNLTPAEQVVFEAEMAEVMADYTKESTLWAEDYLRTPPTMDEFLDDPYWLGATTKHTEDNEGLYPEWRSTLIKDFNRDSRIHNLVLTGSLGCGKTFVMVVLMLYRLTIATLMRNPQAFFGMTTNTRLIYNFLSVSKSAVAETAFGDAQRFMSSSPYFIEQCRFDPDSIYSNYRIPMPHNLWLTAGSKGHHLIGRNVLGVGLDEGNWRLEANPDTSAYELYNEVRARIMNRFLKLSGFLPAISILASSAKDESSFTENVIREINDVNDPSTQQVYRKSVYKVKRHALRLGSRWFRVCYGIQNIEPYILNGWFTEDGAPIEDVTAPQETPPPASRTELVPESYLSEFKRRCRVALQSFSGISVGSSYRLFSSSFDLERAIEAGKAEGLENPSLLELIPASTEDDKNLWEFLDHKKFLAVVQGQVQPRRHPTAKRFAHLDLATNSMAGLSICHLAGASKVEGVIKGGQPFNEYRLIVEYDFILGIIGGPNRNICIEKVQQFLFWLNEKCHYDFGIVTADQYQSVSTLQMMSMRGWNTANLSLDRKKDGYYSWRMGFEEGRIRMFRQEQLMREALALVDGKDKVDHPKEGGKDVSDSAAGAYLNAITADEAHRLMGDVAPSIFGGAMEPDAGATPPIAINLPPGYTRKKVFSV